MYSSPFCRVYNEFGWNYFPEAFSQQLLAWLDRGGVRVETSLDLACGTGVLCRILHQRGIRAAGMDLSEGMIAIAREQTPAIHYDVGDMITYRPGSIFDLVTCTGDALNHIHRPEDVEKIFQNVYGYLRPGGHFIFDMLHEREIPSPEPFDLDFSPSVKARFLVTRDELGRVHLQTTVWEDGKAPLVEDIVEVLHDPQMICAALERTGFRVLRCADHLLEGDAHGTSWYIAAEKPFS